jgi:Kef-type K+ transport system membrane component KefB
VVIGDLFVMVAFALCAALTKSAFGGAFDLGVLAGGIGWELFGSVLLGAVLGVAMLLYLRETAKEVPLFIVGACFVLAETGMHLHLSPLLLSLTAGAVIANLDEQRAQRLNQNTERAALPVFALFFAAAGASLRLDTLWIVGAAALILVVVRAGAIYVSCRRAAPSFDPRLRSFVWMGLISQAGVTFGLAALVGRTFPDFGPSIETLVVAMVTVHELIGPVLMRRALERAGEVHADVEPETV